MRPFLLPCGDPTPPACKVRARHQPCWAVPAFIGEHCVLSSGRVLVRPVPSTDASCLKAEGARQGDSTAAKLSPRRPACSAMHSVSARSVSNVSCPWQAKHGARMATSSLHNSNTPATVADPVLQSGLGDATAFFRSYSVVESPELCCVRSCCRQGRNV